MCTSIVSHEEPNVKATCATPTAFSEPTTKLQRTFLLRSSASLFPVIAQYARYCNRPQGLAFEQPVSIRIPVNALAVVVEGTLEKRAERE